MIPVLFILSDFAAAGIGAGIVAVLWRKSIVKRQIETYHKHEEHQQALRRSTTVHEVQPRPETVETVGVRTAVTKIMKQRGWPIQEHEGVDPEAASNGRHRLATREVRVVRRG